MTTTRHALIIANDRYDDQGLGQLRAPAQDAVCLAEVLGDPEIGDFDVEVLRNERVDAIRRGVERFFSEGRRDDTLMLHFSCHGLKSESGSLYFAARDTEPRLLEATAVSARFIRHCMFRTRARRTVLFLDCCYGGAFSRGSSSVRAAGDVHVLESFAGERLGGGRGWAVITASDSMEYAFEGTQLTRTAAPRPSVFTRAVVEGLTTGEADLDADGEISLDELYEYVFDHVRKQSPNQTPGRTVDMRGDMYLAHSRRRRIVAKPVPPALRKAMGAANFYTRLGAVAELHAWLESPDLAKALGARDALEEIVQNDIRVVSDEARKALADAVLRPDPMCLDFGRVPQDAQAPHRPVHLLGPPLARACTPHPTPPAGEWLRVEESPEGLDVSVDTSKPGRLSGELRLKGIADEATLCVEAEVVPAPVPLPEPEPPPPEPPRPTTTMVRPVEKIPPPMERGPALGGREVHDRPAGGAGDAVHGGPPDRGGRGGVHDGPTSGDRVAVRDGPTGTGRDAVPHGPMGTARDAVHDGPVSTGRDDFRNGPADGGRDAVAHGPTADGQGALRTGPPAGDRDAIAHGPTGDGRGAVPTGPPAGERDALHDGPTGDGRGAVPTGPPAGDRDATLHGPTGDGQAAVHTGPPAGGRDAVAHGPTGDGQAAAPTGPPAGGRDAVHGGPTGEGLRAVRTGPVGSGRGVGQGEPADGGRGRRPWSRAAGPVQAPPAGGGGAPVRPGATPTPVRRESAPPARPHRTPSPERSPRPPAGTVGRDRRRSTPRRAPVLAGVALALAVASVGTVARAVFKARAALEALHDLKGDLGDHVRDSGMLTALVVSLLTAAVALLLCALARHELEAHPRRYPASSSSTTRSVVWTARLLAVPALVVGAVMVIAYPITNSVW
ncbi:caspase family protein [Streptomyces sp. NPDC001381]|uniref:caspase, EACC1-associated type n=1 Tax=Streptomyces sp. NPDC001381 TaxID=3364567 RepID=UPI0036B88404